MPRGEDDDDLGLPPLPPLGKDEEVGTGHTDVVLDIDPGEGEQVGLDDARAQLDDLDPVSLLDLDSEEELAPAEAPLAPGIEIDLAEGLATGESEYGWRDGNEAPTVHEWEGDHGITTLAELGQDDQGETGLDDLVTGLQGDDALPSLPPLDGEAQEEEPLADDLDLGDAMAIELPERGEPTKESAPAP